MRQSIQRHGLALAGFAAACTLVVSAVNLMTKQTIAEQQQRLMQQTLNQLLPADSKISAVGMYVMPLKQEVDISVEFQLGHLRVCAGNSSDSKSRRTRIFLNALLNADFELKPTFSLIASIV